MNNADTLHSYPADARYKPEGGGGEAAGMDNATTGSTTDQMTRTHRMTLDEAHLILNVKRGEIMEKVNEVSYTILCQSISQC
jgi:hypothetical protein